ncbi:hypothetical protein CD131_06175 [Staphylococcus muscae]|nr:hypothetical protein CD131_06175 [Staphylococcus muscae]
MSRTQAILKIAFLFWGIATFCRKPCSLNTDITKLGEKPIFLTPFTDSQNANFKHLYAYHHYIHAIGIIFFSTAFQSIIQLTLQIISCTIVLAIYIL